MKRVFTNNEICHPWAHQTQNEGRTSTGSIFFEGPTIYSYGQHFPMASIHAGPNGETVYFVTTRTYSVTTSGHLSRVRGAIPSSARAFFVHDPTQGPTEQVSCFKAQVDDAITQVLEAKNKVSRAKRFGALESVINAANDFFDYFDIKEHVEIPSDLEALRAERIEQLRKSAELEAKRNEERRARLAVENAERLVKAQQDIELWKSGQYVSGIYSLPKTFLRINGENVETSKGADFPLSHALQGLRLVESVVKSGRPYVHSNHSLHLGHYRIERIDDRGNVTAGCHFVEYDEIQSIAGQLKAACTQEQVNQ